MPITFTIEERNALCEVVEAQKGTMNDVWEPFARQEWKSAEEAFGQQLQDYRFLEYLRGATTIDDGRVTVGMRDHELRESLLRLMRRRAAKLVVEESAGPPTQDQRAFQDRARLAAAACERCIAIFSERFDVRFVVVDAESGHPVTQPTRDRDFALDVCEALNESGSAFMKPAARQ